MLQTNKDEINRHFEHLRGFIENLHLSMWFDDPSGTFLEKLILSDSSIKFKKRFSKFCEYLLPCPSDTSVEAPHFLQDMP